MTGLLEEAVNGWKEPLRRIETTDPVLGGETGPLNAAQKVLGWRSRSLLSYVRSQSRMNRGQIWSPPQLSSRPLKAIAYSPKLRRLVAVGGVSGSYNTVRTSDDGGNTWVERALPIGASAASPCTDVVWVPGASMFVLIAKRVTWSNPTSNLFSSSDGITWNFILNGVGEFAAAYLVVDSAVGSDVVYLLPNTIEPSKTVAIQSLSLLGTMGVGFAVLNDPAVTSTMNVADWYYDRTTGFVAIGDRRVVRWPGIGTAANVVSLGTASTLFRRICSDGTGNGHLFVAGYDSTGGACGYWSDDGTTYAELGSFAEKNDWRAVVYDPENAGFAALAGVTATTEHRVRIWYFGGTNGLSGWQRRSTIAQCYPFQWEDAVYADGALVAVGAASDGGSSGATATSGLWFPE